MLALTMDGNVYQWGLLGKPYDGDYIRIKTPTIVNGLKNIKFITSGKLHHVALSEDGRLFTWGYNDFGQLGLGYSNENSPNILNYIINNIYYELVHFEIEPVIIPLMNDIKVVKCGSMFTVAEDEYGNLFFWGTNYTREDCTTNYTRNAPQFYKYIRKI